MVRTLVGTPDPPGPRGRAPVFVGNTTTSSGAFGSNVVFSFGPAAPPPERRPNYDNGMVIEGEVVEPPKEIEQ